MPKTHMYITVQHYNCSVVTLWTYFSFRVGTGHDGIYYLRNIHSQQKWAMLKHLNFDPSPICTILTYNYDKYN